MLLNNDHEIVCTENGMFSNLFLLSLISNSIYKWSIWKYKNMILIKKFWMKLIWATSLSLNSWTSSYFCGLFLPRWKKAAEKKKWRFGLLPSSFSSFWPYHPYFSEEKTKKCPWSVVGFQFIESILPKFLLIVL